MASKHLSRGSTHQPAHTLPAAPESRSCPEKAMRDKNDSEKNHDAHHPQVLVNPGQMEASHGTQELPLQGSASTTATSSHFPSCIFQMGGQSQTAATSMDEEQFLEREDVQQSRVDLHDCCAIHPCQEVTLEITEEKTGNSCPVPTAQPEIIHQGQKQVDFEEDLAVVKALTMHEMVEDIYGSDGVLRKVLFLTNRQADLLASKEGCIEKLLEAFKFPYKPQLVINLLHSACTVHIFTYRETTRLQKLGLGELPYKFKEEALRDEEKLIPFMRHIIIPLAKDTHAIILCQAQKADCLLAQALSRAIDMQKGEWGSQCPFSVIGLSAHVPFYYEKHDKDALWMDIRDKCKAWKAQDPKLLKIRENEHRRTHGHSMDIDKTLHNLIIVDTVGNENPPLGLVTAPFRNLVGALDRYLMTMLPYIAFKSGSTLPLCDSEQGPWRLQNVLDILSNNCPVVLLDTRERRCTEPESPNASKPKLKEPDVVPDRLEEQEDENVLKLCIERDSTKASKPKLEEPNVVPDWLKEQNVENVFKLSLGAVRKFEEVRKELEAFFDELHENERRELHDAQCLAYLHSVLREPVDEKAGAHISLFDAINSASGLESKAAQLYCPAGRQGLSSIDQQLAKNVVDWFVMEIHQGRKLQIMKAFDQDGEEQKSWRKFWATPTSSKDLLCRYRSQATLSIREHRVVQGESEEYLMQRLKQTKEEYHTEVLSVLCHSMLHSLHANNIEKNQSIVQKLAGLKRLPIQENLQGLRVLQDAWDEFDVAMYEADKYKCLSMLSYGLILVLSIGTTLIIVLNVDWADEGVFFVSLACSFLVALATFLNPVSKWQHLRGSALGLESLIWKYRTRVGAFSNSHEESSNAALRAFQEHLKHWRKEMLDVANASNSSCGTKFRSKVYKHGQRENASPPSKDNHYSPIDGQSYSELRLRTALERIEARQLPGSRCLILWHVGILLCSACSTALAKIEDGKFVSNVAVVTSLSSAICSWMEFRDFNRKLAGYSFAIQGLKNVDTWWRSLSDVEKSALENTNHLVTTTESIISRQNQAWIESMHVQGNLRQFAAKAGHVTPEQ